MSKSVGKILGTGSTGTYGYEKSYRDYLNNYDTGNYDKTLENMTAEALGMSNSLGSMPGYQFMEQGSDAARQRAEQATYQAYVDKLTPQYQQSENDLQTRLANQGIPVGSAAYNRAMKDLYDSQTAALNQAAYQSVISGQDAYRQSLADEMSTIKFNNEARQNYIDQIKSLLEGSYSGYDHNLNMYNVNRGIHERRTKDEQSMWDNGLKMAQLAGSYVAKKADK